MISFPPQARIGVCAVVLMNVMQIGATTASGNFDQRVLAAQNIERERLGLTPLRWNPQLAESAGQWADRLARSHRFEHAPENQITPQGENLWAGTRNYFPPESMVSAWAHERKYFKQGIFPDNSTTGNVEDVGHYTQLVWRTTTEAGCAVAHNSDDDILVCRYSQAGNYIGERPF